MGSRQDSVSPRFMHGHYFQILWNTMWLPYYQITHLQALTDYLELIGVKKIAQLPSS